MGLQVAFQLHQQDYCDEFVLQTSFNSCIGLQMDLFSHFQDLAGVRNEATVLVLSTCGEISTVCSDCKSGFQLISCCICSIFQVLYLLPVHSVWGFNSNLDVYVYTRANANGRIMHKERLQGVVKAQ